MSFEELKIIPPIRRAVAQEGYEKPTPIQTAAIPIILEKKDLVGCAQTGTGKTAAFAIPILQILDGMQRSHPQPPGKVRTPKALILTPTRELALQIEDSFATYGKFLDIKHVVVFGGVSQDNQVYRLKTGIDVLVATPGRLLDLAWQKYIDFSEVSIFVLDEADRMLDMGFAPDVRKIIELLPEKRQNLLFSATMPKEIEALAGQLLTDPVKVAVDPVASTVDKVEQYVYHVGRQSKTALMIHLLKKGDIDTALVFIRTKRNADRLGSDLKEAGIRADVIHGDKSQSSRENALDKFKKRKVKVLVATDIAARGLDIDELSHVINYNVPEDPESYVHRIGRTARAGLGGVAITLCDREEKKYLADIQRLIVKNLTEVTEHPYSMEGKPTHAHRPANPVQRSHARPANRPSSPGINAPRPPQAKKTGPPPGNQPRQGQGPQQAKPRLHEQRPAPRQGEGPRTGGSTVKPHHPPSRPTQPSRNISGHRPPYVTARPHMAKDVEKPVPAPVIPKEQPEEKPRRVPFLKRLKKRMGMEEHK